MNKTKWIRYFIYHHTNTSPFKKSHSIFLNALSFIEDKGGFNIDNLSHDEALSKIKETVKSLSEKDFSLLDAIVKK